LKTAREKLDIITAYEETGSYRAAAELCGTTHKTVKRVVEKWRAGEDLTAPRRKVERNIDAFRDLVVDRVEATRGRISAKRLLPIVRAAGYAGSGRNFRRLVAEVKADWRRQHRVFRPWVHAPGEHLVIDWAEVGRWKIFCAVLGWSRVRFVRFAFDQTTDTTLRLLAECLEEIGGVPAVVLTDRMAALRGQIVANQVVPNAAFVRFATHYGFRPDWCEAGDPQSKGLVEHLAGYAQRDLLVPQVEGWSRWRTPTPPPSCGVRRSTPRCTPRSPRSRPSGSSSNGRCCGRCRRCGRRFAAASSARSTGSDRAVRLGPLLGPRRARRPEVEVAAEDQRIVIFHRDEPVATHPLVAPGEVSIVDDHYGGPRRPPARAVRPRSAAERAFLQLGPVAEDFLRAAAAAGTNKLSTELAGIVELTAAWERDQVVAALERALMFRRFTAADIRSILVAGTAWRSWSTKVPRSSWTCRRCRCGSCPPTRSRS
jgi:transposase